MAKLSELADALVSRLHNAMYTASFSELAATLFGRTQPTNTEKVTERRLQDWRGPLRKGNATPIVLLGIGREHKSGQLVVCVADDVDNDLVVDSLLSALRTVQNRHVP